MPRAARNLAFAIVLAAQCSAATLAAPAANRAPQNSQRANELTLAGFRPGRDQISAATKKIPSTWLHTTPDATSQVWTDPCSNRKISIEADNSGTIQSIDIESLASPPKSTCNTLAGRASQHDAQFWQTGHSLHLGDTKQRVISIYGKPGSAGPSVKNGRELELLYYAFDWAGQDVPQVMEISCDRATGRVVEILLAFPSL